MAGSVEKTRVGDFSESSCALGMYWFKKSDLEGSQRHDYGQSNGGARQPDVPICPCTEAGAEAWDDGSSLI